MNHICEDNPMPNVCECDFEVTYPCFLPMCGSGFHTIVSGGDRCVCLLTDEDLIGRFFRDRYPDATDSTATIHTMHHRASLLKTFHRIETGYRIGTHRVSHVSFDVSGQPVVLRTSIRGFINYVESKQ